MNLKLDFIKQIKPFYINYFSCINKYEVPTILKIIIHSNLGLNATNINYLEQAKKDIQLITHQKPTITYSKKSISQFKIKKGMPLGLLVTLRNNKMYIFLENLIYNVFPRIHDFTGWNINKFDKYGNYNFGLSEQILFPEIEYEKIKFKFGFNITIVFNTKNINHNKFILNELKFPFKKEL